ncbi:MAG: glycine cleavage system protein GcvH [Candidatus Brocadiia bacterium]
MSKIPDDCLYTEQHEWIRVEGEAGVIGITDYAAEQLGDVTFVELPAEGDELTAGKAFGEVESVKAVSDIYAPAGGTVTEANERLGEEPGLINESPYGDGWICKVSLADTSELDDLLSPDQYAKLLEEAGD